MPSRETIAIQRKIKEFGISSEFSTAVCKRACEFLRRFDAKCPNPPQHVLFARSVIAIELAVCFTGVPVILFPDMLAKASATSADDFAAARAFMHSRLAIVLPFNIHSFCVAVGVPRLTTCVRDTIARLGSALSEPTRHIPSANGIPTSGMPRRHSDAAVAAATVILASQSMRQQVKLKKADVARAAGVTERALDSATADIEAYSALRLADPKADGVGVAFARRAAQDHKDTTRDAAGGGLRGASHVPLGIGPADPRCPTVAVDDDDDEYHDGSKGGDGGDDGADDVLLLPDSAASTAPIGAVAFGMTVLRSARNPVMVTRGVGHAGRVVPAVAPPPPAVLRKRDREANDDATAHQLPAATGVASSAATANPPGAGPRSSAAPAAPTPARAYIRALPSPLKASRSGDAPHSRPLALSDGPAGGGRASSVAADDDALAVATPTRATSGAGGRAPSVVLLPSPARSARSV